MTNGISAIAGAQANGSPVCVLGGRAPEMRWGSGSLQEIDHLPFVSPLVKSAETVKETGRDRGARRRRRSTWRWRRPAARPSSTTRSTSSSARPRPEIPAAPERRGGGAGGGRRGGGGAARRRRAAGDHGRHRPLLGARARRSCGRWRRRSGIPVFLNGLGRGCLPADHELAFSRARGAGLKGADVALVVGVPLDFRLGFGDSFGEETKLIRLDAAPNALTANRAPEVDLVGDVAAEPRGDPRGGSPASPAAHRRLGRRSCARSRRRSARPSSEELNDARSPLHPVRVYEELGEVLDRDAIVIGDGGDFVSYAGRFIDTYEPGCWMDPGPFGCLGAGPGQAIGAKLAHPDRQVCLLLGDGAFGFAGIEFDTMARHGLGGRRRDGQQRDLGARAPPDEVPLRLLGGGRAAAGDAL